MGYKERNINDRVKKLLVSLEWSDCSFIVSGKTFKAHKLILGISSPVFEAMFYGAMSTSDAIAIIDIEPDIFQQLLSYIYTDEVELSCIEEAYELLYASRKYMLEHLTDLCIDYIETNLSIDNVVQVLTYPDFMQDRKIVAASRKLFCEHGEFLMSRHKSIMSVNCMKHILESNQMNIPEKDLISHVFDWCSLYCKQNNISTDITSKREVLISNGMYKLLRFFVLSLDELDDLISNENNLILPHELSYIRTVLKSSNNVTNNKSKIMYNVLGSSLTPRISLKLQWFPCYRTSIRSVAPFIIDGNYYTILTRVKSAKSLFINSLCVPARMAPVYRFHGKVCSRYSEQFTVSVMCESENSIVSHTNFINTVEYDSTVNIDLTKPCFIKKDLWYKISFVWHNNRCNTFTYAAECRHRVYKDNRVMFEFDDLSINGNGGSFLEGLRFCL